MNPDADYQQVTPELQQATAAQPNLATTSRVLLPSFANVLGGASATAAVNGCSQTVLASSVLLPA